MLDLQQWFQIDRCSLLQRREIIRIDCSIGVHLRVTLQDKLSKVPDYRGTSFGYMQPADLPPTQFCITAFSPALPWSNGTRTMGSTCSTTVW
jgi:hypothetical protein